MNSSCMLQVTPLVQSDVWSQHKWAACVWLVSNKRAAIWFLQLSRLIVSRGQFVQRLINIHRHFQNISIHQTIIFNQDQSSLFWQKHSVFSAWSYKDLIICDCERDHSLDLKVLWFLMPSAKTSVMFCVVEPIVQRESRNSEVKNKKVI